MKALRRTCQNVAVTLTICPRRTNASGSFNNNNNNKEEKTMTNDSSYSNSQQQQQQITDIPLFLENRLTHTYTRASCSNLPHAKPCQPSHLPPCGGVRKDESPNSLKASVDDLKTDGVCRMRWPNEDIHPVPLQNPRKSYVPEPPFRAGADQGVLAEVAKPPRSESRTGVSQC